MARRPTSPRAADRSIGFGFVALRRELIVALRGMRLDVKFGQIGSPGQVDGRE